jgi:hypothetical protein
MPKQKQAKNPSEQSARFKETARKLDADERPEEFEQILRKVVKVKAAKKASSK